jgi:hypothetical protein
MAWLRASIAYDLSGTRQTVSPLMPTCPSILCPLDGLSEAVSASLLAVTWPEAVDYVSGQVTVTVLIAMAFGIFVGWLAKRRAVLDAEPSVEPPLTPGFEELRWRHEKLVLVERQQVEKQARLDGFSGSFVRLSSFGHQTFALYLFLLAERVREARQKVGSDLSRMIAVRGRLDTVLASLEQGREAIGACRSMAEAQALRLEAARDALRGIAEGVLSLEDAVNSGKRDFSDLASLRRELVELKGRIVALPQGWATSSEETDRRIRELLAMVNEPGLAPVREILLVDGALTASLAGVPGIDLTGGISGVIRCLDESIVAEKRAKEVFPDESGPGQPLEEIKEDLPLNLGSLPVSLASPGPDVVKTFDFGLHESKEPDQGFRDPAEFAFLKPRPAKGFHDLTGGKGVVGGPSLGNGNGNGNGNVGEISLAPLPSIEAQEMVEGGDAVETEDDESDRSLVLFCSNDVELWGKTVYRGARCRARAIAEFPEWAHWVAIRRLDTGERVFAPLRSPSLRSGQSSDPYGFNGSNELFYGARHLGLFSESCPNEVETRFTYGGWGFGHRAHEIAPEVEKLQAAGWEGREIPADTVFEIVIHEELPSLGDGDRVIDGEVRGKR